MKSKADKIELPHIIGGISKNQNCIVMVEALQHNGTHLVAIRSFEASEDKAHLLKDEFILQPFQVNNLIPMLQEAVSILKQHSARIPLPARTSPKKLTKRKSTRARVKTRGMGSETSADTGKAETTDGEEQRHDTSRLPSKTPPHGG